MGLFLPPWELKKKILRSEDLESNLSLLPAADHRQVTQSFERFSYFYPPPLFLNRLYASEEPHAGLKGTTLRSRPETRPRVEHLPD